MKVGDKVQFWSNKVFGVPVWATIVKLGENRITLKADYWGHTWTARIPYGRLCEKL